MYFCDEYGPNSNPINDKFLGLNLKRFIIYHPPIHFILDLYPTHEKYYDHFITSLDTLTISLALTHVHLIY